MQDAEAWGAGRVVGSGELIVQMQDATNAPRFTAIDPSTGEVSGAAPAVGGLAHLPEGQPFFSVQLETAGTAPLSTRR